MVGLFFALPAILSLMPSAMAAYRHKSYRDPQTSTAKPPYMYHRQEDATSTGPNLHYNHNHGPKEVR